jgi:hypothetical protein
MEILFTWLGIERYGMTDSGWRKRQIAFDAKAKNARELGLDYDIHSCSPFCTKPMCVAEAVQAEREACAKLLGNTDLSALKNNPSAQQFIAELLCAYVNAIRARGNI